MQPQIPVFANILCLKLETSEWEIIFFSLSYINLSTYLMCVHCEQLIHIHKLC